VIARAPAGSTGEPAASAGARPARAPLSPSAGARVDVVVTSVGGGEFISAYADLIANAGELARLVVIPDRGTPRRLYEAVGAARRRGISVVAPTPTEQERLLARLGAADLIPWDSDGRRNVGYLLAWMSDSDYVVSIDDDNLPACADMLARHAVVAAAPALHELVSCPSGWFNPCDMLEFERSDIRVFARGYPYARRSPEREGVTRRRGEATVRVNAGLWWGDPDVDAITRLALGPSARALPVGAAVLDRDTWAPINTQNTAVHRDALPAYWFVRMGQRLLGLRLGRFGDILSGYFVQACAKHLGHAVRFGDPVTSHERNRHVLLDDLLEELPGILVLEHLVEWLRACPLEGSSYADAYRALSHALDVLAEHLDPALRSADVRGFLHDIAAAMRRWLDLLSRAAP
jgi:hypothetical protein